MIDVSNGNSSSVTSNPEPPTVSHSYPLPSPLPPPATSAGPPVTEGDIREVEIETLGEQGDGIARTDQGYVIIVPDTAVGDTVRVNLTDVQDNVGFATVIDHGHQ